MLLIDGIPAQPWSTIIFRMLKPSAYLHLHEHSLYPGQRLAVAVSAGADSVALLRVLLQRQSALGLVLSVVHVHHGIRGNEADRDRGFVKSLAAEHNLPFYLSEVDAPARAAQQSETLEEAARHLRYSFFRGLLAEGKVDAIATAHTLDDQAETVLHKALRGAWTEGLGGISPVLKEAKGTICRPLLYTSRAAIEAYLRELEQTWCDDSSNLDMAHTRNRIRHELLPAIRTYNPQISIQLSRMANIARDEEAYWEREMARLGPGLVLPGKPVRGGGRSSSTHPEEASIAIEIERLRPFPPAVKRRLLRWFVQQLRCGIDFDQTERLLHLGSGDTNAPKRVEVSSEVFVQRTAREIQFIRRPKRLSALQSASPVLQVELPVPGQVDLPAFGLRFITERSADCRAEGTVIQPAVIRHVVPGDRVTQRFTRTPRKVKEILERLHLDAQERLQYLAVTWAAKGQASRIIWLRGVELDPDSLPKTPFVLNVVPI